MPADFEVEEIIKITPEVKLKTFFNILKYIKNKTKPLELGFSISKSSAYPKELLGIQIEDFINIGISESEVLSFVGFLKQTYKEIPKENSSKGIASVFLGLPNPKIITGPDQKKYLTGIEEELSSLIYRLLLLRYGNLNTIDIKEIREFPVTKITKIRKHKPKIKEYITSLKLNLRTEPSEKGDKLSIQLHPRTKWIKIGLLSGDKVKVFLQLYNFEANVSLPYNPIQYIITGLYDKTIKVNIPFQNKHDIDIAKIKKVETQVKEIQRILSGNLKIIWRPDYKNKNSVQMIIDTDEVVKQI